MKVFICGPEWNRHLDDNIADVLDELMKNSSEIVLGDREGTDTTVQNYLASCNYRKVTIFTSDVYPRCNVGAWKVNTVKEESIDSAMIGKCDCGLVIWSGENKRIFNNIFKIISHKKLARIYLPGETMIRKIESKRELNYLATIA